MKRFSYHASKPFGVEVRCLLCKEVIGTGLLWEEAMARRNKHEAWHQALIEDQKAFDKLIEESTT